MKCSTLALGVSSVSKFHEIKYLFFFKKKTSHKKHEHMTIQQELNMKIYFSQHFFFLTFCPWSSLSLTPRSGKRSSLSILSIPTSRCRMWLTIMSPAVSTLSPSLAETLYQEVKPSSRDNLYTSSSVTLLWSVRSLLLARRIVGIFVQKSFIAHTYT